TDHTHNGSLPLGSQRNRERPEGKYPSQATRTTSKIKSPRLIRRTGRPNKPALKGRFCNMPTRQAMVDMVVNQMMKGPKPGRLPATNLQRDMFKKKYEPQIEWVLDQLPR